MSGDWSSDVCSSDLFPSHDIRGGGEEDIEEPVIEDQSPLRNWQEEAEVARVWGARGGGGGEDMADTQNGPARGTQGEVGLIPFKRRHIFSQLTRLPVSSGMHTGTLQAT